ncbi:7 transmembrane sweet-taste receptor of 3 GCPR-domain-containing protein [Zopfochytrium polystomum]|nr:7 transmembrane sweet-taste receptor of 3 GCPR-domain-containing protein [Zopfochytrium polystomum]
MEAYPDPFHMNPYCPCFDKQTLDLLFTSTRLFSLQENINVISGAERAAADHGVRLNYYQDTTNDGSGLANVLLDLSRSTFHGTIITDFPSPVLPSTGAIQVAMNSYPNITVAPVSSGENYISGVKNLLPYIGPNNTMTGMEAAKRMLISGNSSNLLLCINPFQGLYAKYDAICAGAAAALPVGSGSVEVFSSLNVGRVDSSQAAILERIKQVPYPTGIIAPESIISDILFGAGSADLIAAIQAANIPIVSVGITSSAIDGMKKGLVSAIIDNGDKTLAFGNDIILTGPVVYSRKALAANGQLDDFYTHAADHVSGFKKTPPADGYKFTIATHASAASGWWAGMRSGFEWSAVNTNSTVVEMVTLATDAATQAAFIRNVSVDQNPVKSDGWTVTLSRWAAFVPALVEADKRNVSIVAVNTWGNYTATSTSLPRVMAFISSDEYTSVYQLAKILLSKNPSANQAICIDSNTPDPTQGSCGAFIDFTKERGLNMTYLDLPEDNNIAALQIIDKALAGFPPTAKFIVVDRTGNCIVVQSFKKTKFKLGPGGQAVIGTFDSNSCVVDASCRATSPRLSTAPTNSPAATPLATSSSKTPTLPGIWPFLLAGPFFADASVLTPQYVNCSSASVSTTIPITPGPTDVRAFPYSSIAWPVCNLRPRPDLTVPVATMPWSAPDAAAVAAICALITALILAAFVILLVNSAHPIIKAMSPAFVAVILIGMLALELMALSWIGDWAQWKCHIETFVLPIAFSLLMGALFIKNYRLYKIFNNPYLMKSGLSNVELGLSIIAVVTPNLILAIVWTVLSPKYPKLTFVNLSSGEQSSYYICGSDTPKTDTIFLILLYAYNAFLAQLSETVYIGYSVYNAVATCIILIPLLFAGIVTDFKVLFWFRAIILLYPVAFAFGMLFGKRILWDTWFADDPNASGAKKGGGNPFSMSSSTHSAAGKTTKELATQSSLTCTLSLFHNTGVMASWKRKTAILQVDTGCLALFEEPNLISGQSLNMNYFALIRETADEAASHYSLGFAQLKNAIPAGSTSRNGANVPALPPNTPEKLSLDFESKTMYEAWAKAFRTGAGGGGGPGK